MKLWTFLLTLATVLNRQRQWWISARQDLTDRIEQFYWRPVPIGPAMTSSASPRLPRIVSERRRSMQSRRNFN